MPYPAKPVPSTASPLPYPSRPVPKVKTLAPFSEVGASSAFAHFITYRPEDQMNEGDRTLAIKSLPAIRDEAALAGIDFDNARWTYQQLECQAVPGHLLLLYQGNGRAGDASLFSASIPREGKGHVRVIPVERRGFALFSPAPVNPLAMAAFNRMRAEEPNAQSPDWLSTSLCYAALTEPRLETSLTPQQAPSSNLALPFPPTLEVGQEGESTVRFVDVATPAQPMQWALTFDAKGQLVKALHFPAPAYASKIIAH
jgi:hypothetical protein